ncbi:MAG: HEAT repeat domain-containing protein [Phycisphaerae bacterium]|nr:HEAT repeat domain-containing protein [Phycisphaerae bacterium]
MNNRRNLFGYVGICSGFVFIALLCCGCSGFSWKQKAEPVIRKDQLHVDARATLLQAVNSDDPLVRAHAMEAIGQTLKTSGAAYLMQGLSDKAVIVRYAAAMGLGDIKYKPAEKKLVAVVENPKTDERVVCAAIYALHEIGNYEFAYQLGVILTSRFELGRASAAQAMGKMGEKTAIGPLKTALGYENNDAAKINMVEALALLGDKPSQIHIEAYTQSYFVDMRLPAIPVMAKLNTSQAKLVLTSLLSKKNPPRIRVAAAGGLGTMGMFDESGYKFCIRAAEHPREVLEEAYPKSKNTITPSGISSIQRLAVMSLGDIECVGAFPVLQRTLKSDDGAVRVAAACAILRMLGPKIPQISPGGGVDETPKKVAPVAGKPLKLPDMETADGMD